MKKNGQRNYPGKAQSPRKILRKRMSPRQMILKQDQIFKSINARNKCFKISSKQVYTHTEVKDTLVQKVQRDYSYNLI